MKVFAVILTLLLCYSVSLPEIGACHMKSMTEQTDDDNCCDQDKKDSQKDKTHQNCSVDCFCCQSITVFIPKLLNVKKLTLKIREFKLTNHRSHCFELFFKIWNPPKF